MLVLQNNPVISLEAQNRCRTTFFEEMMIENKKSLSTTKKDRLPIHGCGHKICEQSPLWTIGALVFAVQLPFREPIL